jgi:hypothetical protein
MLMIETIGRSWRELLNGFCTLQRIQFSAPWQPLGKC